MCALCINFDCLSHSPTPDDNEIKITISTKQNKTNYLSILH